MTTPQIQAINRDRLDGWAKKLSATHATALCLVGVGHDAHRGKTVILACENGPTNAEIAAFLRGAADLLEK